MGTEFWFQYFVPYFNLDNMPTRLVNPWGKSKLKLNASEMNVLQKTWLIHEIKFHGQTCKDIENKFGISRKLLSTWVKRYGENSNVVVKGGRPALFSEASLVSVKRDLNAAVYNVKKEDFVKKLQTEHVEQVTAATNKASCSVRPVSRRSIKRYMEKMKVKDGNAEQTTDARAKATGDKINAISVAAAHFLMMPLTDPNITINADGTSYQTGGGLTDKVRIVYDPEEQAKRGVPLKVMPEKGVSLTAFFVKFYLCMTAAGTTAPPIYIVADTNMKEGEIDVYEVPGLGIGTEINSGGYIVFAKTRAVNENFYCWWFNSIYIPFVAALRLRYTVDDKVPSYFTLDGEDTQIKPMQSWEIRQACQELNIVIGKPPASTTSITQPADAGAAFIASKTKKKNLKTVGEILDLVMTERIKAVVKLHETKVGTKLPAHHIKGIYEGVQTVQYIISTTMRRDIIVQSFEIVGQYDRVTGGCNVEKILSQCKTPFTTEEVTKVWEHLPRLCRILKTKGEIAEKDYVPLGIGVVDGGRCRDDLVLNRRRFLFLTNPAFIASEDKKREDKLSAANEKKEKAQKRKVAAEIKKAQPPPVKRVKKNPVAAAAVVVASNVDI